MGVAGSGKTTVGKRVATRIRACFLDADNFHTERNILKMKNGQALNDQDRARWGERLFKEIDTMSFQCKPMVVACSALKNSMQETFVEKDFKIFHLYGPKEVVRDRLKNRQGHFFGVDLIESQFRTLEMPNNAVPIKMDQSINKIIEEIFERIEK